MITRLASRYRYCAAFRTPGEVRGHLGESDIVGNSSCGSRNVPLTGLEVGGYIGEVACDEGVLAVTRPAVVKTDTIRILERVTFRTPIKVICPTCVGTATSTINTIFFIASNFSHRKYSNKNRINKIIPSSFAKGRGKGWGLSPHIQRRKI